MSAPMNGRTNPEIHSPGVRAYLDARAAFKLAAAEQLGLDPSKLFRLDLETARDVPEMYAVAKWEGTEDQTPTVGIAGKTAVALRDGEHFTFFGAVYLDFDNGRALYAAIGPEPEMFSPPLQAQLDRLRDTI